MLLDVGRHSRDRVSRRRRIIRDHNQPATRGHGPNARDLTATPVLAGTHRQAADLPIPDVQEQGAVQRREVRAGGTNSQDENRPAALGPLFGKPAHELTAVFNGLIEAIEGVGKPQDRRQ